MRPSNPIMINQQTNSGTVTSPAIPADYIVSGSIQASFTDAAAAGTLTLQGSNDAPNQLTEDQNGQPIPVNWNTVTNGTLNATASVSGGAVTTISMQWLNFKWLRVIWVRSAGAGTLTVTGNFQGGS